MTATENVTMTMAYTIPRKKAAIKSIMGTKITRKAMLKAAHENGLTLKQLRKALSNFMNFGYIDGRSRTKWQNSARSEDTSSIGKGLKHPNSYKALLKRMYSYKIGHYTSAKAGNLIHEFIFGSDLRTLRYLDSKHINAVVWYGWLKELSEKGTLLGRKILDYKTQSKFRLTTVIKVIRNSLSSNHNRHGNAYLKARSYGKDLTKSDLMLIRHIEHTLDLSL